MQNVNKYLSDIGKQTNNAMKLLIYYMISDRYKNRFNIDDSKTFAASVANSLFSEETEIKFKPFYDANITEIENCLIELSKDDVFCITLSGAVYNSCYGKYVESGHNIGFVFHPFLGFIRALNAFIMDKQPITFVQSFYDKIGYENIAPLMFLCQKELYRILPNTPDSVKMANQVMLYAQSVGIALK
jgi:hypothetical protein